jgi:hypothetical protein
MSSWHGRRYGYGLGAILRRVIYGCPREEGHAAREPIRQQTEAEIRADERRYDEDETRIEARFDDERAAKDAATRP